MRNFFHRVFSDLELETVKETAELLRNALKTTNKNSDEVLKHSYFLKKSHFTGEDFRDRI